MNKMMTTMLMFTLAAMTAVSGSSSQLGFDVNNDGRIDRAEFHWANPDVVDLHQAFGKLDLNNDGFINQEEAKRDSAFCQTEIVICQNQFPNDGFAFRNCVEPGCHQFFGRSNLNIDAFITQEEAKDSAFCRAEIVICQRQFSHNAELFKSCVEPGCHQFFGRSNLNNDAFIIQEEAKRDSAFCRAEIVICQTQFSHNAAAFKSCVEPGCHQFF